MSIGIGESGVARLGAVLPGAPNVGIARGDSLQNKSHFNLFENPFGKVRYVSSKTRPFNKTKGSKSILFNIICISKFLGS